MRYKLIFDEVFKKDLKKLTNVERKRILKKIFDLEKNPELGKRLVGVDLWSLRIGKHRVIYQIENGLLTIFILSVGHRYVLSKHII